MTSAGSRFVSLFVSQLAYKLLSFGLTSVLTRALTPSAKGVGFFFEMYFLAGGFLSREAIRSLHARIPLSSPSSRAAVRGSGFVCALFCALLLIPLCLLHAWSAMNPELRAVLETDTGFAPVALTLSVAMLLELLGETHWNIALHQPSRGIAGRATAESVSLLCRTVVTALMVHVLRRSVSADGSDGLFIAVIAFGLGHLAYGMASFVLSCVELARCSDDANANADDDDTLFFVPGSGRRLCLVKFSPSNLRAALTFYTVEHHSVMSQFLQENVLRLVLTEGEKFVLSSSSAVALSAQGAYDVATSLGALAARLLFRLWEEFAFNEWARGAAEILRLSKSTSSPTKRSQKSKAGYDDGRSTVEADKIAAIMNDNVSLLHNMCRVAVVVGALSCSFGPLLSGRILLILFGSRWANQEAAGILAVFLCTLPLFGLNGLVEAFGRALSSADEMRRTRMQLLAVSAAYLAGAFFALRWTNGDVKWLIAVNGMQFCLRIAIGLIAAKRVVDEAVSPAQHQHPHQSWISFLMPMLPSKAFLVACACCVAGLWHWAFSMPPRYAEGDAGKYVVPLSFDATCIVAALACAAIAGVSEPAALSLIRGALSLRKKKE